MGTSLLFINFRSTNKYTKYSQHVVFVMGLISWRVYAVEHVCSAPGSKKQFILKVERGIGADTGSIRMLFWVAASDWQIHNRLLHLNRQV
jgi:hypothetical protein